MKSKDLREFLFLNSEENYRNFTKSLLPGVDNIIGVRLPILRRLAREISSTDYREFFKNNKNDYFEEIMLEGLVIGYLKEDLSILIPLIENFIPKIYNWSICDSFSNNLKIVGDNQTYFWEFLRPYFYSQEEYSIRFALVTSLNYFVEEDYLEEFFGILKDIASRDYYVEMAMAWAISYFYVKYPKKTYDFLKSHYLSDSVLKKTLGKIRDSNRISRESKNLAKTLNI